MLIRTSLSATEIQRALRAARQTGLVGEHVRFSEFDTTPLGRSTVHAFRHTVQLGSANYAEWGWFLALVFLLDPAAEAGRYRDADDFRAQTGGQFWLSIADIALLNQQIQLAARAESDARYAEAEQRISEQARLRWEDMLFVNWTNGAYFNGVTQPEKAGT